jgi:dipeptidyl-peptidase-4
MKQLTRTLLTALTVCALSHTASAQTGSTKTAEKVTSPVRFDPAVRDVEGWKVHVEPSLIDGAHREEGSKALTMLANHLQRIKILVPAAPLAKLQTIEIWIEHDHPRLKSMQYHPSRDWLVNHGHDPRLTRKVHVTQARELLSRGQMLKHPAVVLHELAHGYHDQILSFDQPEIIVAYKRAKESGSYTNVLARR